MFHDHLVAGFGRIEWVEGEDLRLAADTGALAAAEEDIVRHMNEDHGDALMDALTSLGVDRVVLVGLSWGGMIGMRVAVRHAKRIAAMVLMDTNADAEDRANVVKYRILISFARRFGLLRE